MNIGKFKYKLKIKKLGLWSQFRGDRAAQSKRYRAKYPHKNRIHQAVFYAIKRGELKKPNICSICKEEKFLVAHHKDYKKALQVIWVCFQCHNHIHKTNLA